MKGNSAERLSKTGEGRFTGLNDHLWKDDPSPWGSGRLDVEKICSRYWKPVYTRIRQKGYRCQESEDLTQEFFVHMLQHGRLDRVEPFTPRFQSFLTRCLNHFLINELDARQARKRRVARHSISFEDWVDHGGCEQGINLESSATGEIESKFVVNLVKSALSRLKTKCANKKNAARYDDLLALLMDPPRNGECRKAAKKLNMTPDALKVSLYRLRQCLRSQLCEELFKMVPSVDEYQETLRALGMNPRKIRARFPGSQREGQMAPATSLELVGKADKE